MHGTWALFATLKKHGNPLYFKLQIKNISLNAQESKCFILFGSIWFSRTPPSLLIWSMFPHARVSCSISLDFYSSGSFFPSFLLPFPMQRPRAARRRGLSSIFLVSLEKNASSFFKLRPVVNHHHRANGSAVSSPKLKQKAWPLQTPMPMLGVENKEIRRIYK